MNNVEAYRRLGYWIDLIKVDCFYRQSVKNYHNIQATKADKRNR